MKKMSLKSKITVFSAIAALISIIFCSVLAYAIGTAYAGSIVKNELKAEVRKAEKVVEDRIKSGSTVDGIKYEGPHNGIIYVFLPDGTLVFSSEGGPVPSLPDFDSKDFASFKADNENFYVYDKKASKNDTVLHVRGVVKANDPVLTNKYIIIGAVCLIPLEVLLVAFFVWLISKICLSRLNKLNESASSIIGDKDLKKRIPDKGYTDEIADLTSTINNMLSRLESSFDNEKRFISDASHELRTPTSVILAQSEMIRAATPTAEEYAQANEIVYNQATKMKRLITELLEISRAEQDQSKKEFETLDVSELTEAVISESRQQNSANIELSSNVEPKLIADVNKILYIIMLGNLIDNAFKYGKDNGHIKVSAYTGQALDLSNTVIIMVEDDGIGISKENLPKIWDRFYRADQSRTGDKGSGLGLSMVKWIVNYHGGTIKVESEENVGTKFTIELPCKHARN